MVKASRVTHKWTGKSAGEECLTETAPMSYYGGILYWFDLNAQ